MYFHFQIHNSEWDCVSGITNSIGLIFLGNKKSTGGNNIFKPRLVAGLLDFSKFFYTFTYFSYDVRCFLHIKISLGPVLNLPIHAESCHHFNGSVSFKICYWQPKGKWNSSASVMELQLFRSLTLCKQCGPGDELSSIPKELIRLFSTVCLHKTSITPSKRNS